MTTGRINEFCSFLIITTGLGASQTCYCLKLPRDRHAKSGSACVSSRCWQACEQTKYYYYRYYYYCLLLFYYYLYIIIDIVIIMIVIVIVIIIVTASARAAGRPASRPGSSRAAGRTWTIGAAVPILMDLDRRMMHVEALQWLNCMFSGPGPSVP